MTRRGAQKEQYAFLYLSHRVSAANTIVYEDPGDVFIREPFIVQFSSNVLDNIDSFTLVAIHTQPKVSESNIYKERFKYMYECCFQIECGQGD